MNAMYLVICALVIFALAYRFYFGLLLTKVLTINPSRVTPTVCMTIRIIIPPINGSFGTSLAAIAVRDLFSAGAGCQFGYFPGFMWMLVGAVMAGAVHDLVLLTASVRHDGKSIPEIARCEISKLSGITTSVAVVIIILVALAGLGLVVANSLSRAHRELSLFELPSPLHLQ